MQGSAGAQSLDRRPREPAGELSGFRDAPQLHRSRRERLAQRGMYPGSSERQRVCAARARAKQVRWQSKCVCTDEVGTHLLPSDTFRCEPAGEHVRPLCGLGGEHQLRFLNVRAAAFPEP